MRGGSGEKLIFVGKSEKLWGKNYLFLWSRPNPLPGPGIAVTVTVTTLLLVPVALTQ